jgi:phosphatidylglycerol:prolipoprotein diacylglycerol transferase
MISFPAIDPVAIAIGPLKVHWYGIAYVVGILLACHWAHGLIKRFQFGLTHKQFDDLLPYAVIGIVIGGRLGHTMLYDPGYYLNYPLEILQVWKGGMSFHGGLLGVAVMTILYTKRHKLSFYHLADLMALISPIGLFFGRLANFINAELYGIETGLPWGVVFPKQLVARHPTQIYEAFLEGLVLFLILNFVYQNFQKLRACKGLTGCFFLSLYALFRLSVEPFKVQEVVVQLGTHRLGVGIILCMLMLLLSTVLIMLRLRACRTISEPMAPLQ